MELEIIPVEIKMEEEGAIEDVIKEGPCQESEIVNVQEVIEEKIVETVDEPQEIVENDMSSPEPQKIKKSSSILEESPMSLTKSKRKHKPTYIYESFQKSQLHNKRMKKQSEKRRNDKKSREKDNAEEVEETFSESDYEIFNAVNSLEKQRRMSSFDDNGAKRKV